MQEKKPFVSNAASFSFVEPTKAAPVRRTDEEIEKTIAEVLKMLEIKEINRKQNFGVREGLKEACRVMERRETDDNYKGLELLKTTQGRAIASLAVDYMSGLCTDGVLLNVPIKGYMSLTD